MSPARITAIVAEDESDQRRLLVELLERRGRIVVVAQVSDGLQAVDAIQSQKADVVFLDVRMPELDAFGVIEAVGAARMPLTVFVTAFDAYAVRAFEVHALDYLLKPFDAERLAVTVERIEARLATPDDLAHGAGLTSLLTALRRDRSSSGRVAVRVDDRIVFLETDRIERIEADGRAVVVHSEGGRVKVRESITAIAARLDEAHFVRVHRSTIVNVHHIREMQPWFKGAHVIILRSGTRVTTGPAYRDAVRKLTE